jgi:prepilin-type N-terminal cleavage/methylation domain-containing protein
MPQSRSHPKAFTLVELMVVILIIGILIAIIIPVAGKIKLAGQKSTSLAQINALRASIEAYHGTYNAYPGPLNDLYMFQLTPGTPPLPTGITPTGPGSKMTQTENMVLGLLGGLRNDNGTITYSAQDVGSGPRSLNPGNPGQHSAFFTDTKSLTKGFFSDSVDNAGSPVPVCRDSSVPEFVDTFTDPLPVIYLRARKGSSGVMTDEQFYNANAAGALYQYDVRQYSAYLSDDSGGPLTLAGKNQSGRNPAVPNGLWKLASSDSAARGMTDTWDKNYANYAITYFKHPSLNPPGTINEAGTPRSKDSFILISAGADRIFGTTDDLTSFGSPVE